MRTIFEQGSFQPYYTVRLDEAMEPVLEHSQFQLTPTIVAANPLKIAEMVDILQIGSCNI